MNVNYDIWAGESIQELIHTIAEFRFQLVTECEDVNRSLSDEINFLQHYFDSESSIIVANDCGAIVGYMATVDYSDVHHAISEYEHYGSDLKISEGPFVHPSYRNMGIAKGLIQESLTICEIKLVSLLIIDPPLNSQPDEIIQAGEKLAHLFGFNIEHLAEKKVFKKPLVIESAYQ